MQLFLVSSEDVRSYKQFKPDQLSPPTWIQAAGCTGVPSSVVQVWAKPPPPHLHHLYPSILTQQLSLFKEARQQ